MEEKITIFTDGSSLGNPGPGGWGAVILFGQNSSKLKVESQKLKVVELGGYEKETTNNRMEMTAAIKALTYVRNQQPTTNNLQLYTDSTYLLNGITKWIHGWHQNNWKTKAREDVLNKDLWQKLFSLVYGGGSRKTSSRRIFLRGLTSFSSEASGFSLGGWRIDWKHVRGHVGIVGNERADLIATSFAEGEPVDLFHGPLSHYEKSILGEDLLDIGIQISHSHPKRSHKKAYSYVSLVDGRIEIHKTWADCEMRVKGVSGAKYKKAVSKEDEVEIIQEWQQKLF